MKKKAVVIISIVAAAVLLCTAVTAVVYIVPFMKLGKGLRTAKENASEIVTEEPGSFTEDTTYPAETGEEPFADGSGDLPGGSVSTDPGQTGTGDKTSAASGTTKRDASGDVVSPQSGKTTDVTAVPTKKTQDGTAPSAKPSENGKTEPASSSQTKPQQPTKPAVTDPPAAKPQPTKPAVTDPPATKPQPTNPPATKPAVTNPPVTNPPATKPQPTNPPATKPAVTNPPVTNPPTTSAPVQTVNEYDIYRSGHFYVKGTATEDNGVVTPLELAVDDKNIYMLSQMDGVTIGILINKGKMYMIYDNAKKYCELSSVLTKAADLDPEELAATAKESYSNLQPLSKAVRILEETVNGYPCNTYYFRDADGSQTTASISTSGKLVQLRNYDTSGKLITTMNYTTVTANIPAEKLAPPKNYKKVNMVSFMLELSEVMGIE